MHKKAEARILKSGSQPFSEITWESSFKMETEFPNYLWGFESRPLGSEFTMTEKFLFKHLSIRSSHIQSVTWAMALFLWPYNTVFKFLFTNHQEIKL